VKRIALFQFHRDWDVCANHLQLLRAFNPGIEIHGLFGGGEETSKEAEEALGGDLISLYLLRDRESRWKWQNTDLAVREWFRDAGHRAEFDVVHVVQWDLLFFDSLPDLYRSIPPGALGLTGITSVEKIAHRWHWTLTEPHKSELAALREFVRERFGDQEPLITCLGPGYCLPREFLSRYAEADVPELGHDELRLPLFGRLLGFPIADTGFYPRWFDPAGERSFNANGDEIEDAVIRRELALPGGRRVFHPCRKVFEGHPLEELLRKVGARAMAQAAKS
jgi:hypothetical protein